MGRNDNSPQAAGPGKSMDASILPVEKDGLKVMSIGFLIPNPDAVIWRGPMKMGVIENMSGFVCPKCGQVTNIFKTGGGERMAHDMGVPFLGRIPIDPMVGEACDAGTPFVQDSRTETAKALSCRVNPRDAADSELTSRIVCMNKSVGVRGTWRSRNPVSNKEQA